MTRLGLSWQDKALVFWRMCISTVLNWYARWPLKWQLRNLWVWLLVRYTPPQRSAAFRTRTPAAVLQTASPVDTAAGCRAGA